MAKSLSYAAAGVDTDKEVSAVHKMSKWLMRTHQFRAKNRPVLGMDFFANVIELGGNLGLAISTDGVGSKVLIAQLMNKYDTIGIDCVATNVNDVICVGAEPLALVDYVGIQKNPDDRIFGDIAKGLHDGAELAGISIPGGETAQLPDIIKGEPDGYPLDLVGTCVGLVPLDRILDGKEVAEGDVIIGLPSSGIHSNGLTLARKVLLDKAKLRIDAFLPELGCTVGEELLKPTRIYVKDALRLVNSEVDVKALINITSDGLLNLTRLHKKEAGYIIEHLLEEQPIFQLIRERGRVPAEEMFHVYNMGVGFCVIVSEKDTEKALAILGGEAAGVQKIGHVSFDSPGTVQVEPVALLGEGERFRRIA